MINQFINKYSEHFHEQHEDKELLTEQMKKELLEILKAERLKGRIEERDEWEGKSMNPIWEGEGE